jgi:hypothetical protein
MERKIKEGDRKKEEKGKGEGEERRREREGKDSHPLASSASV